MQSSDSWLCLKASIQVPYAGPLLAPAKGHPRPFAGLLWIWNICLYTDFQQQHVRSLIGSEFCGKHRQSDSAYHHPLQGCNHNMGHSLDSERFGTVLLSQYIKHCKDKNSHNWLTQFLALRRPDQGLIRPACRAGEPGEALKGKALIQQLAEWPKTRCLAHFSYQGVPLVKYKQQSTPQRVIHWLSWQSLQWMS